MHQPVISGTGVFTPSEIITNDELVVAFNAFADKFNTKNSDAIAAGEVTEMAHSSSDLLSQPVASTSASFWINPVF